MKEDPKRLKTLSQQNRKGMKAGINFLRSCVTPGLISSPKPRAIDLQKILCVLQAHIIPAASTYPTPLEYSLVKEFTTDKATVSVVRERFLFYPLALALPLML